jgi:hypothetical protein
MVDRFVVPVGRRGDLRCFWKAWSCKKCDRLGMPWYEFERVLQDMPRLSQKPTESVPSLRSTGVLLCLPFCSLVVLLMQCFFCGRPCGLL